MKQNEADRLAENLIIKFGLPVSAVLNADPDNHSILLKPIGVHPNQAFQVNIQIGWRSLLIELLPGKFAGDFLQQLADCPLENKHLFSNIIENILKEKGIIVFKINNLDIDPSSPDSWPHNWKSLVFSLKRLPLEINTDNHKLTEDLINLWVERFFGCVIALSPLEELDIMEVANDIIGLPEGAKLQVTANRYERSRYNRTVCINFHSPVCKVCDLDFRKVYGKIGEGFIHVHHVVPVSLIGNNYFINPIKDLIPVCPNCHSMLHKNNPPFSVQELKQIINNSNNKV